MNGISDERFEELVSEALDAIPQALWDFADNVAVTVQQWPSRSQMASVGLDGRHSMLLGLYEGVPLTSRSHYYGMVPPDKITIFQAPILRLCPQGDEDAVRERVRRTVLHEVAHHFGISDQRLLDIGAY